MDRKYFTNRKKVYKNIAIKLLFLLVAVILFEICVPLPSDKLYIIPIMVVGVFSITSIYNYHYPVIDNDKLIRKHPCFNITFKKYKFDKIDKIVIEPVHFYHNIHFPGMSVYLKGKNRARKWGLDGMSKDSIKPFVEELRAKGIEVKCEPYTLDNGKTMYL